MSTNELSNSGASPDGGVAFPLGDILSVTTGHLVSRDHIDGVYRVCDFMSGESNMTHQLPRVARECEPVILAQHPDLAGIVCPPFDGKDSVMAWLDGIEAEYGATRVLVPMASVDHTSIDPIAEFRMMKPGGMAVVVKIDDES